MSYRSLPAEAIRRERRHLALAFAYKRYLLDHPGCDPDEAGNHAARNWPAWMETALDYMAICDALDEAIAAAAPMN